MLRDHRLHAAPVASLASLALAVLAALVLGARPATGQTGDAPIRRMHHTAWTGDAGPPLGGAHRLARSPDGYLWLGAMDGLMRFDGVRFAVLDSTTSPLLRATEAGFFNPLIVDASGALWISTPDGDLLTYRDGTFRVGLAHAPGHWLTVDGAGHTWLYGDSGVYWLRDGRAERVRLPPGVPDDEVTDIVRDTGQGVWVGTRTRGLWHVVGDRGVLVSPLDAKPRAFVRPFLQAPDGTVWAGGSGVGGGIRRLVGDRWVLAVPFDTAGAVVARAAVVDRDGAVWFGTNGNGLLRWSHGTMDAFTKADGLSDRGIDDLLADADGTIWVSTATGGLDQLRPAAFGLLDRRDGLPFESVARFAEDASGSVWASGAGTGRVVELRAVASPVRGRSLRAVPVALPPDDAYELLTGARGGGAWLGPRRGGLVRYRDGHATRWTARDGLPAGRFYAATETRDGALWLATVGGGFGVLRDGRYTLFALPGYPQGEIGAVTEDAHGHVWVAPNDTTFLYEIVDGRIARRLGPADGIISPIVTLALERGDTLWGAMDSGLVRIAHGRATPVRGAAITASLRYAPHLLATEGHLWIVSTARIARYSLAPLHIVADGRAADVTPRLFGVEDGIPTPREVAFAVDPLFRAGDARLWIATPDGIVVTDPTRDVTDHVPPQAHVEEIVADGRTYRGDSAVAIRPNPDRVTIHYTATGLFAPGRVRLQVRLEGVDPSWIDASAARVATYTQLRPGAYRFRVRAWNGDGVASPREAVLRVDVLPAWYQSLAFRAATLLAAIAAVVAVAGAYQRRRTRLVTARLREQFEATLAERTRIARELHDTLLQSFGGLVLQLDSVRQKRALSADPSADELARILALADSALVEARRSVWDMRTPAGEQRGFAEALEDMCRAIANDTVAPSAIDVRCSASGTARRLRPELETAALHMAREALHNAARHARCGTVIVALTYDDATLALSIVDDGIGMTPEQLAAAPRLGHFGVVGMRERAAQVGGVLTIETMPGAGTRIELRAPYASSRMPSGRPTMVAQRPMP